MARKAKYYLKRSHNSWSVFERGQKHKAERFCIVPMVTHYEAKKCCAGLNAGQGAWDWLGAEFDIQDYSLVELGS